MLIKFTMDSLNFAFVADYIYTVAVMKAQGFWISEAPPVSIIYITLVFPPIEFQEGAYVIGLLYAMSMIEDREEGNEEATMQQIGNNDENNPNDYEFYGFHFDCIIVLPI